jgi:signal transduction histidine kinase
MNDYRAFNHELQNQISSIQGLCELIQLSEDISEIKNYSKMVSDISININKMRNDFKTYKNTGIYKVCEKYIDTRPFLNSILTECLYLFKKYNITPHLKISIEQIYTDPSILRQVLLNIISNACKYSGDSGGNVYISCIPHEFTKNHANIIVKDEGIGMVQSELDKIGKPFYRSKRLIREGSGLGISIIKKLINQTDMTMDIKSTRNIGTTIVLDIPMILEELIYWEVDT